ncbi:MAG: CaiB/BaiF CoA transferase family protein [Chloroflexota bacterium]
MNHDTIGPRPLDGLTVLDCSQFLAGPSASLRLADLGADVIKLERRDGGDASRILRVRGPSADSGGLLFQIINRDKRSIALDFKDSADRDRLFDLAATSDVFIESFRPGGAERLGIGYEDLRRVNTRLVYGSVTGYGSSGPWTGRPGQDLLVQALAGLPWLSGESDGPPLPVGLSVVDTLAGAYLAQGILACLVRRSISGAGARVEVSLLESAIDLALEGLSCFLTTGQLPERSKVAAAHPYLAAPYGLYETSDGYLALAMGSVTALAGPLHAPRLAKYSDEESWMTKRDEIKDVIAQTLRSDTTAHWLGRLEPAGVWCAPLLTWSELVDEPAFEAIEMLQTIHRGERTITTTRCPIRIDGRLMLSNHPAPRLDEHADQSTAS